METVTILYVCTWIGIGLSTLKYGLGDDAAIYDTRYRVIKRVSQSKRIRFLYKMSHEVNAYGIPLERDILKNIYPNVKILEANQPVASFLSSPDLIVVDGLTTALFEVLLTSKPVIFLADPRNLKFTEQADQLLRSRATIIESTEAFLDVFGEIDKKGKSAHVFTEVDHTDHRFIHKYAVEYRATDAVDRTIRKLDEIMQTARCEEVSRSKIINEESITSKCGAHDQS